MLQIQRTLDPSRTPSANGPQDSGLSARTLPSRAQGAGSACGELGALRMLTNLDRGALAAYGTAYALWAEANEALQKYGRHDGAATGLPDSVALLSIANRQAEIMMRIASEFGFTLASRSRISMPAPPGPSLFDHMGPPKDAG